MKALVVRMTAVIGFCLLALSTIVTCDADEAAFYTKVWPCNSDEPDSQCGVTKSGAAMTCFAAKHLGGSDFCTERCDPELGSLDSELYACLRSGALLRTCRPGDPTAACPAGFSCFRTDVDLRAPAGLCIVMPVCEIDADCAEQSPRSTCGGTLVREKFSSSHLSTGNLQCVQRCGDATASASKCPDGEKCIDQVYDDDISVPDICVPECSRERPCPPNFYCLNDTAPHYPGLCVPGIPGRRCSQDEDCITGHCVDVGANSKNCALECRSNEICSALSGVEGLFFCAKGGDPNGPNYCIAKGTFAGEFCYTDDDCSGRKCSNFDAYHPDRTRSLRALECHAECSGPGTCPTQASVPFSCLAINGQYGECYPADFGIPCHQATEVCMGELKCLMEDPNLQRLSGISGSKPGSAGGSETFCTRSCNNSSDCSKYSLTLFGYCVNGVCRPPQPTGDPCQSGEQCSSKTCNSDGTCA
ncbi:MAG TPA: hypothetical protein VIV60_15855 [Polyangiaceae bacterium]